MHEPSSQARFSRNILVALMAACASSAPPRIARAQSVPTFQFEANKAAGIRNVLLVRVNYSDANFASNHDNAYYGSFFGNNAVNLGDYFKQLSGGKFGYQVVGAVGPITFPDDPATPAADESKVGCWQTNDRLAPNPSCRTSSRTDARETATLVGLVSKRFNLAAFDANRDGTVDPSELTLVFVTATGDLGKTRDMGCAPAGAVRVCGAGAFFAENTNFATMAHELWHSVSGADLYTPFNGPARNNERGTTLMGATGGKPTRWTVALDPWNKIRAGWVAPRPVPTTGPGTCLTLDAAFRGGALPEPTRAPIAVYDPSLGGNEYFLIEYRKKEGYDAGIDESGVLIWYVKKKPNADDHWVDFNVVPKPGQTLGARPAPGSDDVVVMDGSRASYVHWGPNHRLETRPMAQDELGGTNFILAAGAAVRPRAGGSERFTTMFGSTPVYFGRGEGAVRLVRPDGTDTPVRLLFGADRGDGRMPVQVLTTQTPVPTSATSACYAATAETRPSAAISYPSCNTVKADRQVMIRGRVLFSSPVRVDTPVTLACDYGTYVSPYRGRRVVRAGASELELYVGVTPITTVPPYFDVSCTVSIEHPATVSEPARTQIEPFTMAFTPSSPPTPGALICGDQTRLDARNFAVLRQLGRLRGIPMPPVDPRALKR